MQFLKNFDSIDISFLISLKTNSYNHPEVFAKKLIQNDGI